MKRLVLLPSPRAARPVVANRRQQRGTASGRRRRVRNPEPGAADSAARSTLSCWPSWPARSTNKPVTREGNYLVCQECQRHYPIREGIRSCSSTRRSRPSRPRAPRPSFARWLAARPFERDAYRAHQTIHIVRLLDDRHGPELALEDVPATADPW